MRVRATRRAAIAQARGLCLGNPLWDLAEAVPTLDLRFAENKSLIDAVSGQSLITFTRTSSGTYVGSDGLIKTAAANEARFDHDPATGESLGLLVEEQRTNLLLHNRTLTNAAWVAINITAAKDQTGVDGVNNSASSITASAGNATILQTITSASAARATCAYVKRITGTGTVQMTQDNGTTWTAVTVTSSWSRVTIPSATVTNPVVGFRVVTSGDAIAVDYVQLESAAASTSAIETTSAAVTRAADLVSITGTNFSSWYQQSPHTVYLQYTEKSGVNFANYPHIVNFHNSSDFGMAERVYGLLGGRNYTLDIRNSNVLQNTFNQYATRSPQCDKIAFMISSNRISLVAFGSLILGQNTSITMPSGVNRLHLGRDENSQQNSTNAIARLTFFPQQIPDINLQLMTQ